jgi:hypothetical protein
LTTVDFFEKYFKSGRVENFNLKSIIKKIKMERLRNVALIQYNDEIGFKLGLSYKRLIVVEVSNHSSGWSVSLGGS